MKRIIVGFLIVITMSTLTAMVLGYLLLYEAGVSGNELINHALLGAAALASLLAVDYISGRNDCNS